MVDKLDNKLEEVIRGSGMYLRDSWYVAGWSDEVARDLTARTILEEEIVLYRKEDGGVVALENACVHRKLPLSDGRLVGDRVQCGYHGMEYGCSGVCERIPGQKVISPKAKVRSYRVVEKWNWIWIWMGDADKADESLIMDVPRFDDPEWGFNRGPGMAIDCHYQVYTDNLLDPAHVSFVHQSTLAGGGGSGEEEPVKVDVDGSVITASRWTIGGTPAPLFAMFHSYTKPVDRLQSYQLRLPSLSVIDMVCADSGTGAQSGGGDNRLQLNSYNFITPETADSCRYYWFQLRNFLPNDSEVTEKLTEGFLAAFREDAVILKAVHKGMKNMKTPNINLAIDSASVRARRALDDLIGVELVE